MKTSVLIWTGLLVGSFVSCGGAEGDSVSAQTGEDALLALRHSERALSVGYSGEDVRALTRYLSSFGYLPNSNLSELYPQWRSPVADSPAHEDAFDASTEAAVRYFQRNHSIEETGVVDAVTRELILQPRCGVPELTDLDPSNKFDPGFATDSSTSTITWRLLNSNSMVPQAPGENAITAAFASWSNNPHTFVKTNGLATIRIRFSTTDPNGQPWATGALGATLGKEIYLNPNITWSTATPTPSNAMDFQSVMVHEIGHALGYQHSSVGFVGNIAIMFPTVTAGVQRRTPAADDKLSALARSGVRWTPFDNNSAIDVDVDSGPTFENINVVAPPAAAGGASVWQLSNGVWSRLLGQGAVRVSGNGGIVWIVQDDGDIYRWTSSWTKIPGCAQDIGVGGDDSVWIIGCSGATNGYQVLKYNGSSFVVASGSQGGYRISVGMNAPNGLTVPWIVSWFGTVYRRSSNDASSGTWSPLPGTQVIGSDIAVSANGYAWLVGNDTQPLGSSIYLWNEQVATASGNPPAVALSQWRKVSGNAVSIATNNLGMPFVVDSAGRASYGY